MRPLALDLFCGAGGASMGLHQAGFDVVGVDLAPQPRYPFRFVRGDALRPPVDLCRFDLIWASPPCQAYSDLRHVTGRQYDDLIYRTSAMLAGHRYVIENVVGAPLFEPITLCGSMFGLGVWRHRIFQVAGFSIDPPACNHAAVPKPIDVTGTGGPAKKARLSGGGRSRKPKNVSHAREVMGIGWMSRYEISQAIPPAYAKFIGSAALQAVTR